MDIEFLLGPERLVIKSDVVTVAKSREVRAAMKKVAKSHDEAIEKQKSDLRALEVDFASRIKQDKDETDEEWEARITPILEEREAAIEALIPEDTESFKMKLAFECLKVLGQEFGQAGKVTPANFDQASWDKTKLLLAKFLINNECELGMVFLPPKTLN